MSCSRILDINKERDTGLLTEYLLEADYIFEHDGKNLLIKFIKENFSYSLDSSDEIKIEGDIQVG